MAGEGLDYREAEAWIAYENEVREAKLAYIEKLRLAGLAYLDVIEQIRTERERAENESD